MRTGLTKSQKITEICFDEKEPLIHIRTHNTDLKTALLPMPRSTPQSAANWTQIPTRAVWSSPSARGACPSA